ncbi:MAG: GTP cyclohydrolase II [Alphaproteobacteria bacterium]
MNRIQQAIKALQNGRPILIIDDRKREDEGDLVVSCQTLCEGSINFMVKHSSGIICFATTKQQLERLGLPPLESPLHKRDVQSTPFAFSFEASSNITTGISAKDRAYSLKIAAHPDAKPADIISPGHVMALKAAEGGLSERQGHTEAAVDICKMANLLPSAALVEVPDENGDMLKGDKLNFFAETYNIPLVSIEEIIQAQKQGVSLASLEAQSQLPTKFGNFTINVWKQGDKEHIALIKGDVCNKSDILVRIHSQCLTGDIFGSLKCDCQSQLHHAMEMIEREGQGVILWLRQEGRDIGLINKIKAYQLQDEGLDTVDANKQLGLPVDARNYQIAADILQHLDIRSLQLITNNPHKIKELKEYFGGNITHISSPGITTKENANYLKIKKEILGHLL